MDGPGQICNYRLLSPQMKPHILFIYIQKTTHLKVIQQVFAHCVRSTDHHLGHVLQRDGEDHSENM